jgi:hypothetical protein
MPDLGEYPQLGRLERILLGEMQVALEEATLVQRIRRTNYHHLVNILIQFLSRYYN